MGCCDFTEASLDEESQSLLAEDPATTRVPASTARVSLAQGSGGQQVNSVDVPAPKVYYVIVGFGPAAVINHTTLRASTQGRQRLGQYQVMHIGFHNPWPNYLQHGMGQVPYLLSLPGFTQQPNAPRPPNAAARTIDGGLHSRDWGNAIDDQYRLLARLYHIVERRGWLAWVQHRRNPASLPVQADFNAEAGGPQLYQMITQHVQQANARNDWPQAADYRLIVAELDLLTRTPKLESIYAAYIDFCTGPGRPIVLGNAPALAIARTAPWLAPEVWDHNLRTRRILNGVDAIVDQVVWAANERICVTAGGGVGLNAAEKARNNNCYLDWFGRTSLNDTFANPRNHTFLRHPVQNRQLAVGELDGLVPIGPLRNAMVPIPPTPRLRFGREASLTNAALGQNQDVTVTLGPTNNPSIVDNNNAAVGFTNNNNAWDCAQAYLLAAAANTIAAVGWPSTQYDRLVVPNGQAYNGLGQPFKFTEIQGLQPYVANGRMTAIESADQRVRLLGACCQVFQPWHLAAWNQAGNNPSDLMWAYRATLAVSAVPDGFILSGSNIATANGYFVDHPNNNVNTMTLAEITAALPALTNHPAQSVPLATAIVNCRNRANGYANYAALMAVVNAGHPANLPAQPAVAALQNPLTPADAGAFTAVFRFDYP